MASSLKPTEAWEALADIVTTVVKRPYREEPLTKEEWQEISYRVQRLAEKESIGAEESKNA